MTDTNAAASAVGSFLSTLPGLAATVYFLLKKTDRIDRRVDENEKKIARKSDELHRRISESADRVDVRINTATEKVSQCTQDLKTRLADLDKRLDVCKSEHKTIEGVLR